MCLLFGFIFAFASYNFYLNALIPHALFSGVVGGVLLISFVRNLIFNRGCIFGNKKDCLNPKD
jgi:hypothetical protein